MISALTLLRTHLYGMSARTAGQEVVAGEGYLDVGIAVGLTWFHAGQDGLRVPAAPEWGGAEGDTSPAKPHCVLS